MPGRNKPRRIEFENIGDRYFIVDSLGEYSLTNVDKAIFDARAANLRQLGLMLQYRENLVLNVFGPEYMERNGLPVPEASIDEWIDADDIA